MAHKQWLPWIISSIILLLFLRLGYLFFVKEWFIGVNGLQSARSQARILSKPVLIYFYDPHSSLGAIFEQSYLKEPVIESLLSDYYKVRINGLKERALFHVSSAPALVTIRVSGKIQEIELLMRTKDEARLISSGKVRSFLLQGLLGGK